jgi:hypothetical protein
MKSIRPLLFLALTVPVVLGSSQRTGSPSAVPAATTSINRVIAAANAFLATLSDAQRAKVAFDFAGPQRTGWSNLPSGIFTRQGLRLGDLTARQREAALALVASALSRDGYQKVTDIMNGDEVLKNAGGGRTGGRPGAPGGAPGGRPGGAPGGRPGGPGATGGGRGGPGGGGGSVIFGRDEYYIALLGRPSATTPWLLQFGGHHLAINVTVAGQTSVLTPSLPAAQPASYTLNGQTIRPLGDENDKSFALINALNPEQQKQAILNYQVSDLVLGPGQDGKTIQPEGIPASALNASQQTMLLDLAHEWVGILNDEAASAKMAELRANLPRTYFAWSGATKNGGLAYYRIQGPTIVIEYAPQQGDLDHIHTIYRDPTNDYAAKLVKP